MTKETITFRNYTASDYDSCCALFDENCPAFFAEDERDKFQTFLSSLPRSYEVGLLANSLVGSFGFDSEPSSSRGRVSWIMVSRSAHGAGVGTEMMNRVIALGGDRGVTVIDVAASHISAPFFAKFGAKAVKVIQDGWGAGMHRVDMELSL